MTTPHSTKTLIVHPVSTICSLGVSSCNNVIPIQHASPRSNLQGVEIAARMHGTRIPRVSRRPESRMAEKHHTPTAAQQNQCRLDPRRTRRSTYHAIGHASPMKNQQATYRARGRHAHRSHHVAVSSYTSRSSNIRWRTWRGGRRRGRRRARTLARRRRATTILETVWGMEGGGGTGEEGERREKRTRGERLMGLNSSACEMRPI